MSKEYEFLLKLAISNDLIDEAKALLESQSGCIIEVSPNQYAKIGGCNSPQFSDLASLIENPPVEYLLNLDEFKSVKSFANGMGCGINPAGLLVKLDLNDKSGEMNFNKAVAGDGVNVFEIRSPNNIDVSELLAAHVVKQRLDVVKEVAPSTPKVK